MEPAPIRVLHLDDSYYIDVNEFVDVIIRDLRKQPDEMVSSRDEIIFALQRYAKSASDAMETS